MKSHSLCYMYASYYYEIENNISDRRVKFKTDIGPWILHVVNNHRSFTDHSSLIRTDYPLHEEKKDENPEEPLGDPEPVAEAGETGDLAPAEEDGLTGPLATEETSVFGPRARRSEEDSPVDMSAPAPARRILLRSGPFVDVDETFGSIGK